MSDTPELSRADRRARTRAAILDAAQREFAARGYEAATIRAVAERARCDPSLVMQHFGSKQQLFQAASGLNLDMERVAAGPPETLSERLVREVFEQMDARPGATASTLRSMLTHDKSADEALKLFNADMIQALDQDAGDLGALRGQLIGALTLGTAIARYVMKYSAVEQASVDDLVACLRPAVDTLLATHDDRQPPSKTGEAGATADSAPGSSGVDEGGLLG